MSTSLARRIRRIGVLPQPSLAEVMDENQRTKLTNSHNRLDRAQERVASALVQIASVKANASASEVEHVAAHNLLIEANSEQYAAKKNLDELLSAIQQELGSALRPRLQLTPDEIAAETNKLRTAAKARRAQKAKA